MVHSVTLYIAFTEEFFTVSMSQGFTAQVYRCNFTYAFKLLPSLHRFSRNSKGSTALCRSAPNFTQIVR